ncbi:hypothetical protein ACP4J0_38240, partial [Streptomyces sp. WG7]
MKTRLRKPLVAGLLAVCTVAGASSIAYAVTGSDGSSAGAAAVADGMPYAVEDFQHPGADRILQEKGITVH